MTDNAVSRFSLFDGNTAWYGAQSTIDVESVTIPFLQHELILNFGDFFSVNHTSSKELHFTGIQTNSITTRAKGKYEAMGIMFSPTGIWETFGLSMQDFGELCADAPDELAGPDLFQKIRNEITVEEKLEVFIRHVATSRRKKPVPVVVLQILKHAAKATGRPIAIKSLADELQFTSKHLISTFHTVVGLTPKKFLLLCQLNGAVRDMLADPERSLTQIALRNGFFDQSHFIRVFRKFTGLTPFAFRAKRKNQEHSFPNTVIS